MTSPFPPPPGPTAAAPPGPQGGPGRTGLFVGGIIAAVGVLGGLAVVIWGMASMSRTIDGYQRVPLRGGTITIEEPGEHQVFYERAGIESSDVAVARVMLGVEIIGPDGVELRLHFASTRETYSSFSGQEGIQLGVFDADQAGEHRIGIPEEDRLPLGGELAVGRRGIDASLVQIGLGAIGGGLLALLGGIILVVTAVRRSRHRRRQAWSSMGGGHQPAAAGWVPTTAPGWTPPAAAPPPPMPPPPPPPPPPANGGDARRPPWSQPGS